MSDNDSILVSWAPVRGEGSGDSSTSTLLPTLLQTGQIGQTGVCAEMKNIRIPTL